MTLFYFPENPALCPQGIQAEVRLGIGDQGYIARSLYFNPGNNRSYDIEPVNGEWEPRPGSDRTFQAVRFQITRPATSPSRSETLSIPLPSLESWKGFYNLAYLLYYGRVPNLRLQCGDATPLEFKSEPNKTFFAILEDASTPSKLRVLQYSIIDFRP
jgi:hypothetical protein